jgi:Domain of unknown function (DUF5916)
VQKIRIDIWKFIKSSPLLIAVTLGVCQRLDALGSSGPGVITATRVEDGPVLDGILDDKAWKLALPVTNFTQRDPDEGEPPTEQTEVRIVYDNRALYIGVSCFMSSPGLIIANEMSRDFESFAEDNVKIIIDTHHDLRNGFLFVTNPNGARYDALVTDEGNGVNADWNGIWDVHTFVSDQGWFAEIEIPFSTLRFTEDAEQVWGINFERLIRSKREEILWQGFLRNYGIERVSHAGVVVGIRNVSRGSELELKPYALAGVQREYPPVGDRRSTLTKIGLDMKYPVTPTLTLDITTNTDFAQVESDRAQINLTRFPLYFPEKRDFFLEGSGIFNFNFGASPRPFYSRRIGIAEGEQIPIIIGGRLVGKAGSYDIGLLDMQTAAKGEEPTTNYSVVRVKRDILSHSSIGILATNKELAGRYNRLFGADMDMRFSDLFGDNNLEIGAAVAGTQTSGLSGPSLAYRFLVDYPNDVVDHFIGIRSVQADFNPEVGFVSRHGKQISWAFSLSPRPHILGIRSLEFLPVAVEYYLDVNNVPESAYWEWRPIGIHMESGEDFEFNILRNFDRLDEEFEITMGAVIPQGRYYSTRYELQVATSASRVLSGELFYGWGDYYTGTRTALSMDAILKTGPHLSFSVDYSRNDIRLADGGFVTHEVGSRIKYAFSTVLDASLFGQWNSEDQEMNMNFRVHWIPEIGSDVYLVYNDGVDTRGRAMTSKSTFLAKAAYRFVL